MSINIIAAKKMAVDYLNQLSTASGVPYAVVESQIREEDDGWYFPYQSAKFVSTGNFDDSVVGNWPIFVDRSGDYVGPRRPGMPPPARKN